jgi:hypothetical protein
MSITRSPLNEAGAVRSDAPVRHRIARARATSSLGLNGFVRADRQPDQIIHLFHPGCAHEDRHRGVPAESPAYRDPVQPGEYRVEDHESGVMALK